MAKDLDFVRVDERLIDRAISVLDALKAQGLRLYRPSPAQAASLRRPLAKSPGAVEHFEGGYVVYTPEQKFFGLKILPSD